MVFLTQKEKTALKISGKNTAGSSKRTNSKEESSLLKACMEYLTLKGGQVIRNNTGLLFIKDASGKSRAIKTGSPGSPDLIAFMPQGRVLCVECKSKKGRLTDSQKGFIEALRKNGHEVVVVRSLDELMEVV